MTRTSIHLALFAALVAAAGSARADYLINAIPDEVKPRVMLVVDTSGSMNDDDDDDGLDSGATIAEGACPYGAAEPRNTGNRCFTRLEAAKAVLDELLTNRFGGMEIGLIRFTTDPTQVKLVDPDDLGPSPAEPRTCGVCPLSDPTPNLTAVNAEIQTFVGNTWTPLAAGLDLARDRLTQVRKGLVDLTGDGIADDDPAADCRPYYVILLTDGEETCGGDPVSSVKMLLDEGIPTFVLGFGKEVASSTMLTEMARTGSTSVEADNTMSCWGSKAACSSGSAIFAGDTATLLEAMSQIAAIILSGEFSVSEPILTTIPFEPTELSRVRNNAVIMGSFRKNLDDVAGHLYAMQLYYEVLSAGKPTGTFLPGDFENPDSDGDGSYLDVDTCGAPGNVCRYDAGELLHQRVSLGSYATDPLAAPQDGGERRIYTAISPSQDRTGGALTLQLGDAVPIPYDAASGNLVKAWQGYLGIPEIKSVIATDRPGDLTVDTLTLEPSDAQLDRLGRWLHGDPSLRDWPLGDVYHAAAAVVGAPGLGYRNWEYPKFAQVLANRTQMIYVGANDGMIHAFYAGPDLRWQIEGLSAPRWEAGQEAWAYLPVNQLARALMTSDAGLTRFYSQDLACRVDDVLVQSPPDPSDPYAGWRTILMCGQGWGGSWYVGIDVTQPEKPQFLWEFTDDSPVNGLGRTWSVPGVGIVNIGGKLVWGATFGGGYNTDMHDCASFSVVTGACTSGVHDSYRLLNQPFYGRFPQHGDGVWSDLATVYVLNMATGELIKRETGFAAARAVTADVPVVDTDNNGLVDSAYVAGFSGLIGRLGFEGSGPANRDPKDAITASDIVPCPTAIDTGTRPLVNKPSVAVDPASLERVFAFAGSGLSAGNTPDEVRWRNAPPALRGYAFDDNGTAATCSPRLQSSGTDVPSAGNVCTGGSTVTLALNGAQRLVGAPLLSAGPNHRTWLDYVTWTPPPTACQDGEARAFCVDVTVLDDCTLCMLDLDGDGIYNNPVHPLEGTPQEPVFDAETISPPAPTSTASVRMPGPGDAGTNPSERDEGLVVLPARVMSWREVFF